MPEKIVFQDPLTAAAAIIASGVVLLIWRVWKSAGNDEPAKSTLDLIAAMRENTVAAKGQLEQFRANNGMFEKVVGHLEGIERDIAGIKASIDRELARQQGEREARR